MATHVWLLGAGQIKAAARPESYKEPGGDKLEVEV